MSEANEVPWRGYGRASDGTHVHLGRATMALGTVLCGYQKRHPSDEIGELAAMGHSLTGPGAELPICPDCRAIAEGP